MYRVYEKSVTEGGKGVENARKMMDVMFECFHEVASYPMADGLLSAFEMLTHSHENGILPHSSFQRKFGLRKLPYEEVNEKTFSLTPTAARFSIASIARSCCIFLTYMTTTIVAFMEQIYSLFYVVSVVL